MDRELPREMIAEILMRTPLNMLEKCKKVSNDWKSFIYDSTFFPFYLKRTGTVFGFFIQDMNNTKYVSKFVGVDQTGEDHINESWPPSTDVRILASCNQGIVCCETQKDFKNYRWSIGKPTTNQWKTIPNPKLRRKTVGIAIIVTRSKPLRFKIIRLSVFLEIDGWLDTEYACEVFDSKTWRWRRTRSVFLHYDEVIDVHQPAITVGEFVYWKTSRDNVLAFDVTQQHFDKFSLPEIDVHADQFRLVEYQGELGFSCSTPDGNVQLWLTNSRNNYEWTREMEVDVRVLEETFIYPTLVGYCNSSMMLMKAFNQGIFFNIEDSTFTKKEIDFELRYARQYFQFCSDVERVDLRCLDQDE